MGESADSQSDGAHGKRRRVAVAVDASERSLQAVEWAAKNLIHPGDDVTILHVQPQPDLSGGILPLKDAPLSAEAIECIRTHISTMTRRLLDNAQKAFHQHQVEAKTLALIGDAREMICKFVEENHCHLLVVGSRGLGAMKSQLLGSVSAFCVHHSAVPVVVVRTN